MRVGSSFPALSLLDLMWGFESEEASTPAGIEEPKSASQTEQDLKTTYNTEDLKPTYNTEEPKSASETEDLKTTYNTEEPKTTSETQPTSTPPNSEEPKSTIETEPNPKTTAPMTTSNTTDQKPTSSEETTADPSSAPQNTQKQQGADRPFDEPSSEEHDRIKETKKEAEDAAKVDTSGPGPKSLEEKASETGGMLDAGAGGATTGKVEKSSKAAGDNDDGPQKESHGEGTGEKYVKSSGMKADGGDFDAAKPGAAREADRKFYSYSDFWVWKRWRANNCRSTRGERSPSRSRCY
jgi:hypothetical protein